MAEEERYPNILEAQLRARYPALSIEVVDLGVQGFETVQEEKILYRMWGIVRPDLTVLEFYVNDTDITYDHYLPYRPPDSIEAEAVSRTTPAVSCLGALV